MVPIKKLFRTNRGESFVWFSSLGLTTGLLMIIGILALIIIEGFAVFWPKNIALIKLNEQSQFKINNKLTFAGEKILEREKVVNKFIFKNIGKKKKLVKESVKIKEAQFYTANRDIYGFSFHYVNLNDVEKTSYPNNLMMIERNNNSRAILIPQSLLINEQVISTEDKLFLTKLDNALKKSRKFNNEIHQIVDKKLRKINQKIKSLFITTYSQKKEAIKNHLTRQLVNDYIKLESQLTSRFPSLDEIIDSKKNLKKDDLALVNKFIQIRRKLQLSKNSSAIELINIHKKSYAESKKSMGFLTKINKLKEILLKDKLNAKDATGKNIVLNIGNIITYYFPNQLSVWGKLKIFFLNIKSFFWDNPREANTQGGVFPAIIGTFVMTILMAIAVTPLGVIAAIYLKEYAKQGRLTQTIRIAINNLAGIPSIAFGAFGLGFFVYGLGYSIDQLFYSDQVESGAGAVFGTGGLLWSSLTLALMTLPVVIVASEEALASVPKGIREGALGCGSSKWQMISSIVIPTAIPGIITGIILAMARGAGEVAPLMLVGVVKSAPNLPIDSIYPFIHLDYKFMHLGFHIYDLGFQSPDSEAAKPIVFATTLLLISIVCTMNLFAIFIRQHLRKKYATGNF